MRKSLSLLVFGLCILTSAVSYGSNGAPTDHPFSDECVVNSVDDVIVADNAGVLYHDVVFYMTPEFRVNHVNAKAESLTEGFVSDLDHPPGNSGTTAITYNRIHVFTDGKESTLICSHPLSWYKDATSPLIFYNQRC